MACVLTSALGEHAGYDGLAVHTKPLMTCFPSPSGKRLCEIDLAQPRLMNILQTRPNEDMADKPRTGLFGVWGQIF